METEKDQLNTDYSYKKFRDEGGVITAEELLNMDIPPLNWIVEGLIPAGLTFLCGAPKTGKSILALRLALAVSTGATLMGDMKAVQGRVLYLALEDTPIRLQERTRQIIKEEAAEGLERLSFFLQWKDFPEGLEELDEWLDGNKDTSLVIVDTLACVRAPGGSRDVYQREYAAIRELKAVADERQIAILLIHHLNKRSGQDDILKTISGSTGLTGAADTILIMNRDRDGGKTGQLQVTGRDVLNQTLRLEFDDEASVRITGEMKVIPGRARRISPQREAILSIFKNGSGSKTPTEITEMMGGSANTNAVNKTMWSMAEDGMLIKDGRGKYDVPTPVLVELAQ